MARCTKCSAQCGDDHKTRTKYRQEKNLGDREKVILLQLNDMVDIDNVQVATLKAILMTLVDEHFYEEDELDDKRGNHG